MSRIPRKNRSQRLVFSFSLVLTFLSLFVLVSPANALPVQPHFNHFLSLHPEDGIDDNGNDVSTGAASLLAQQQAADQAYPATSVGYDQTIAAYNAFQSVKGNAAKWNDESWQLVGPTVGNASAQATYTGRPTVNSGRITSLLVSKICNNTLCPVWVGAAGGGVWVAFNGLAAQPTWHSISNGLASNAIGSLYQDPTDLTGRTIYVGTGEPNGSSDSEAGVGLYKSTDYGLTWQIVPGSIAAAKDRAIAAIAVDPTNPKHIYIGTALARHGASSVNGGRWTPPGTPKIGLYESTDGGKSFTLTFSQVTDATDPTSPNGRDYFRGGVSKIELDRTGLSSNQPSRVYFSMFDYGLYRKTEKGVFEQVFASAGGGLAANSLGSRTEFALAPMGKNQLRIYLGDTDGTTSLLYRVDNANVPAATLTNGTNNPGWLLLSNPTQGTPGYASYNFCETQCSYDMVVESPAGHPDMVWLGGSMAYDEVFTANPPSNGRAVQRSVDAGATFTDMTDDNQVPPLGMHPDQHALAFSPTNPDIAFAGSDGGLVRVDGQFTDASSQCAQRGLDPAGLAECQISLKVIPTHISSLNAGLATLQFQSVTVNPNNSNDLIGGTQDNGAWAFSGKGDNGSSSLQTVGGDGGQTAIDYGNTNTRFHMYYNTTSDVNFNGNNPADWDYVSAPLDNSGEFSSFYIPLVADPAVGGTVFAGLEHVWRTQDDGGDPAYLDPHCNEYTGDFINPAACGDWVPLGPNLSDATFGPDKTTTASGGSYVVAIGRTPADHSTLWAATRLGRLFISTNANAPAANVTFTRLDTSAQPSRFISGIAVDPKNPYHAIVTFSGYNAYTPSTPGHIFDVKYNPSTGKATWTDLSYNLGDAPVTSVVYDRHSGDVYIATDFGVAVLDHGSKKWHLVAAGLPTVAVYGLTIDPNDKVLYAATHGRSVWRLKLED